MVAGCARGVSAMVLKLVVVDVRIGRKVERENTVLLVKAKG